MEPARRLDKIKPYFFATLGKKIVEMREEGIDVIRVDMGSPDLPPADNVIEKLASSAQDKKLHGYTLGSGTHKFREAVAEYYKKRFEVDLDPQNEVIDLIGSKEGLFIINQVVLNPGDISLVPDPGYGVYKSGAFVAEAEVYSMPLLKENDFLPDLNSIPDEIAEKAKLLWLNYPNNPTGAVATLDFFKSAVDFAKEHGLIVVHDAPYVEVVFDDYIAPSILQVPGAKDHAVEFNSFSKAFNMAGWRLGMALGHSQTVKRIESYKSLQDSAIFAPILNAGIEALKRDDNWIRERNEIYKKRRDIVLSRLRECGVKVDTPQAALYVWASIPIEMDSMTFCTQILQDIGVSTTPGVVFGPHGEGYFRISLVTPTERLEEAMDRLAKWLKNYGT